MAKRRAELLTRSQVSNILNTNIQLVKHIEKYKTSIGRYTNVAFTFI